MKYQIRRNVFETNSSSVHVIAIGKSKPSSLPNELHFYLGEYGWRRDKLDYAESRASYLYTGILEFYNYGDKNYSDIKDWEKKISEALDFITETLNRHGVEAIFQDPEEKKDNYGCYDFYIDHGDDEGHVIKEILSSEEKLMNYLFSPDSFVETGNDNEEGCPNPGNYTDDESMKKYDSILTKWN